MLPGGENKCEVGMSFPLGGASACRDKLEKDTKVPLDIEARCFGPSEAVVWETCNEKIVEMDWCKHDENLKLSLFEAKKCADAWTRITGVRHETQLIQKRFALSDIYKIIKSVR